MSSENTVSVEQLRKGEVFRWDSELFVVKDILLMAVMARIGVEQGGGDHNTSALWLDRETVVTLYEGVLTRDGSIIAETLPKQRERSLRSQAVETLVSGDILHWRGYRVLVEKVVWGEQFTTVHMIGSQATWSIYTGTQVEAESLTFAAKEYAE